MIYNKNCTSRCAAGFGKSRRWYVRLRDCVAALGSVERECPARGGRRTFRVAVERAALGADDARHRGRLGL